MTLDQLHCSLHYLHVSELKTCCENFNLSVKGKKLDLINGIIHFLQTGEKLNLRKYPSISLTKNKDTCILKPDALMLKGAYKNDLKTRLFFKGIIGEHFHFTAFGVDWLENRWMETHPHIKNSLICGAMNMRLEKNMEALLKQNGLILISSNDI